MTRIIIPLLVLITAYTTMSPNGTLNSTRSETDFSSDAVLRTQIPYIRTRLNYQNGGTLIIYPVGLFTPDAPLVFVTVDADNTEVAGETFTAFITANTTTSATVFVYKVDSSSVVEPASDVVKICVFAFASN